ncbi:MAG: LPS export ABC transporter ATP-binding protein [Bacteroidales bacterium]|nr:LPS export ABC transporter ATP-binding protein [Bacteroidales bacterium]
MRLSTDNVVKIYRSRTVVKGVSVQVDQGKIVGLLGPNGAGKTTTFYMVVGIIKPYSGKVFLGPEPGETIVERDGRAALMRDGQLRCVLPEGITPQTEMPIELTRNPMYRRAQMGVGYLAQEASVFRQMTVEDNILSILQFRKDLDKVQRQEKLESLLNEFRLQHIRRSKGIQLSGGERRRTEIARALANDPMFLLLDEPFAGVDPIAVQDIQDIVVELTKRNIGVLITDHNVRETLSITDRAYLLYEGSILQEGTPEDLANDPDVREKYLGRDFVLKRRMVP